MGTSSPGLSVLQWPICAGVRSPRGLRGGPRVLRGVYDGGGDGRSLLCVHTLRGRPLRTRVREKGVWAGTSVCTCAGLAHTRGAPGFPSYHCALFILSVFHCLKYVTLFFFLIPRLGIHIQREPGPWVAWLLLHWGPSTSLTWGGILICENVPAGSGLKKS